MKWKTDKWKRFLNACVIKILLSSHGAIFDSILAKLHPKTYCGNGNTDCKSDKLF